MSGTSDANNTVVELIEINDDEEDQNEAPPPIDVVSVGSTDTGEEDNDCDVEEDEDSDVEEDHNHALETDYDHVIAEEFRALYASALEVTPIPPIQSELLLNDESSSRRPAESEIQNINPDFHKLSLYNGHKKTATESKKKEFTQKICLSVEAVYKISADEYKMITVLVRQPNSDLDSSGHLGDISKSCSSFSTSPTPTPQFGINRTSFISSSSGSSALESASTLNRKMLEKVSPVDFIDIRRIDYLIKKWKNSNLIYALLDHIDKIVSPGEGDKMSTEEECFKLLLSATDSFDLVKQFCSEPNVSPNSISNRSNELKVNQSIFGVGRKRLSSEPILPSHLPKKVKIEHGIDRLIGMDVFCEGYNTMCYFYARIIAVRDDTFAEVIFTNGNTKVAALTSLIIRFQAIVGHQVMFTAPSNMTNTGIVTKIERSQNTLQFVVATDRGDTLVPVQCIHLPEDQAKEILSEIVPSSQFLLPPESDQAIPSTSGMHKGFQIHSSASWDSDDSSLAQGGDSDSHILGCDIEGNVPLITNFKLKSKSKDSKDDDLLGPYNVQGNWFYGFNFLITSFPSIEPQRPIEEIDTDSEDFPFSNLPFLKNRLINQIKGAGGVVYDKFEDIPSGQYSKTILVSNRPCLTPKYVKCVAVNIPVVVHDWIILCTTNKKFLALQELPAGWSIEYKRFIERYERLHVRPLDKHCIQFAYLDKRFYKFWSNVCRLLGAITCQFNDRIEKVDYIVAEDGCYKSIVESVENKVPVVSYSWLVQTVIHGHIREISGHQWFGCIYDENEEI